MPYYTSLPENYFYDYKIYLSGEIRSVTEDAIVMTDGTKIEFSECRSNFFLIHRGDGTYVGEHCPEDTNFSFYASPDPVIIRFNYDEGEKYKEFLSLIGGFGNKLLEIF